jgi:DNA-binding MarR family transcriptional regulator
MSEHASSLQSEIRQSKPFRSPGHAAVVGLLLTADVIRRAFTQVVEPFQLTLQQYNVLRILRGAGCEGIPTLEIGERMIEHAPGVTRLLDRLDSKGLVRRERCPLDRRQVLCHLNAEGRALVDRLDAAIDIADDEAVATLSADEQRLLIELLEKIRAGHRRQGGEGAFANGNNNP